MKTRNVIYLITFAIIAFLIFKYGGGEDTPPLASISKQDVLEDFADLQDNPGIPSGTLGGTYYTTEVFFPDDYTGDLGNEFYVAMEDGHSILTQKYVIYKTTAQTDQSESLQYKLKDSWEDFKPPAGKYESHKYDGKKWIKVEVTED
ncbi:Uncharacterized [Syntrophomonas zehnderi OL-4]|uniref:Uncharacterized n=1 Tax=Syntrophomonas zehnderi OL-4 TaxID=690567 RepID=A0A0E4C8J9_9FIRM|nr:hypothetical protein [Syntrophomonas zehnderi]CFX53308.1 Uncharacterized [Syntrophomonas zehnderi OL-4]